MIEMWNAMLSLMTSKYNLPKNTFVHHISVNSQFQNLLIDVFIFKQSTKHKNYFFHSYFWNMDISVTINHSHIIFQIWPSF